MNSEIVLKRIEKLRIKLNNILNEQEKQDYELLTQYQFCSSILDDFSSCKQLIYEDLQKKFGDFKK